MSAALTVFLSWIASPALWATAIIVGGLGEMVQRLVRARAGERGWRGLYFLTYRAHALPLAALLGLIPGMPVADGFGATTAGHVLFYASGGAVASAAYPMIVKTILALVEHLGARAGKAIDSSGGDA